MQKSGAAHRFFARKELTLQTEIMGMAAPWPCVHEKKHD